MTHSGFTDPPSLFPYLTRFFFPLPRPLSSLVYKSCNYFFKISCLTMEFAFKFPSRCIHIVFYCILLFPMRVFSEFIFLFFIFFKMELQTLRKKKKNIVRFSKVDTIKPKFKIPLTATLTAKQRGQWF